MIKDPQASTTSSTGLLGIAYLYAQFWGRIEVLRHESLGVSITSDKRGAKLKEFFACLESQRIRLVDRIHQKAIGELAVTADHGRYRATGVRDFAARASNEGKVDEWLRPLIDLFANAADKRVRQRILVYGVVVHALIDTLDPKHYSTHARPSYPNKLSKASRRDIRYRIFGRYLRFVKNRDKYSEVGKKGTPRNITCRSKLDRWGPFRRLAQLRTWPRL